MEALMLNDMTALRAPVPQNQFIALDPLAMRARDYHRPAISIAQESDTNDNDQHIERDPFSLASPFCNPDI